ncbi:hypothetical protein Pmani_013329 [Petrolisthes manimaculis]|uniref:Transposase Tc1-like domain-containing protein n=1 Tax=Petrolisthes manimaculis TaxID=1843537 RepID=A0AAE1PYP8_9EUCA|nr:hypothetical protein Pmani_013329 [Petrolisthes manimaculis]
MCTRSRDYDSPPGQIRCVHTDTQVAVPTKNNLDIPGWEESGTLTNLPRGRPQRCTTPSQDQEIVAATKDSPHTNVVAIRDALHLDASVWTVRKRVLEAGLHHRVPAAKEHLTQQHREGRLQFAREYVNRGDEVWGRVCHESMIS